MKQYVRSRLQISFQLLIEPSRLSEPFGLVLWFSIGLVHCICFTSVVISMRWLPGNNSQAVEIFGVLNLSIIWSCYFGDWCCSITLAWDWESLHSWSLPIGQSVDHLSHKSLLIQTIDLRTDLRYITGLFHVESKNSIKIRTQKIRSVLFIKPILPNSLEFIS